MVNATVCPIGAASTSFRNDRAADGLALHAAIILPVSSPTFSTHEKPVHNTSRKLLRPDRIETTKEKSGRLAFRLLK